MVYATDALAQQVDEMQFVLGEGPCLEAYRGDRFLLCPRLDDEALQRRWPGFTVELADLGVAAVFAFPIPGQHRPLGVLELYRRTEGELLPREQQSAMVCAAALGAALESNWRDLLSHSSSAEAAMDAVAVHGARAGSTDAFTRTQVHVAAGMVAVQLAVSTGEALDRLRGYAYGRNRPIVAVADDVVARRLSFRGLDIDDERGADS